MGAKCSLFVRMAHKPEEQGGEVHTLTVLEELRREARKLWGNSGDLYSRVDELLRKLADPTMVDIPLNLPFRVEMWDSDHIRMVVSASTTVSIAHGAFDAATRMYPDRHWTLRNGILLIRKHGPA